MVLSLSTATGALPCSTAATGTLGTPTKLALALSTLLHSVLTAATLPYSTPHMAFSPSSSMATNAHSQHCPLQSNTRARASSAGQVVVNGTGVNVENIIATV